MNIVFANGSSQQRTIWEEGLHRLLNLPFDAIPITVDAEFVDPSVLTGHGHTDLALTNWRYDYSVTKTQIRDDAPGFGAQADSIKAEAAALGLTYSAEKFCAETGVHEVGHSFFAALPQANRLAICKLFGVNNDDVATLQPAGTPWQDHIAEGIAETFKEAFLPRQFRVFPNRTNRRIPYSKFPEFRSYFRVSEGARNPRTFPCPSQDGVVDLWRPTEDSTNHIDKNQGGPSFWGSHSNNNSSLTTIAELPPGSVVTYTLPNPGPDIKTLHIVDTFAVDYDIIGGDLDVLTIDFAPPAAPSYSVAPHVGEGFSHFDITVTFGPDTFTVKAVLKQISFIDFTFETLSDWQATGDAPTLEPAILDMLGAPVAGINVKAPTGQIAPVGGRQGMRPLNRPVLGNQL